MSYMSCEDPAKTPGCTVSFAELEKAKKAEESSLKLRQEYATKQLAEKQHNSEVHALELIGVFIILALLLSIIYKNITQPKNRYNSKILFLIWTLAFIAPPIITSYFTHKGTFEFTPNTALTLSAISKIGLIITIIWISVRNKLSWYLAIGLLLVSYFFSFGIWVVAVIVLLISKKKKYCEKCKKFYNSDNEYCEECGDKLSTSEKFCKKCNRTYSFDKSNCSECGEKLKISTKNE